MPKIISVLAFGLALSCAAFSQTATPCVDNAGKPCPEWLHRLIGQYPPLPDAPLPQRADLGMPPATFWTFRTFRQPALRSNRQVLRSKTFWVLHVAAAASVVAACRNHSVGNRENPGCWGSELPAVGAMSGLDFLADRWVSRSLAVEAPIYAVQHYIRAARP